MWAKLVGKYGINYWIVLEKSIDFFLKIPKLYDMRGNHEN
jgi:hypothetical protein